MLTKTRQSTAQVARFSVLTVLYLQVSLADRAVWSALSQQE